MEIIKSNLKEINFKKAFIVSVSNALDELDQQIHHCDHAHEDQTPLKKSSPSRQPLYDKNHRKNMAILLNKCLPTSKEYCQEATHYLYQQFE